MCRLGYGLEWGQGTMNKVGVRNPLGEGAIWGDFSRSIIKYRDYLAFGRYSQLNSVGGGSGAVSCCQYCSITVLQIIEADPHRPVYADVFEHPTSTACISTRPIWSDMTSLDTITQWR